MRSGEQVLDMAMRRKMEREDGGDMDGNNSTDRECKRSKRVKVFAMDDKLSVIIEKTKLSGSGEGTCAVR